MSQPAIDTTGKKEGRGKRESKRSSSSSAAPSQQGVSSTTNTATSTSSPSTQYYTQTQALPVNGVPLANTGGGIPVVGMVGSQAPIMGAPQSGVKGGRKGGNGNRPPRRQDGSSSSNAPQSGVVPATGYLPAPGGVPPTGGVQPYTLRLINPPLAEQPLTLGMRVLKVSSKSNPKTVAGGIAHTTRAGEAPTLMGTGQVSVNQAIKAIAIARGYLEENKIDLTVSPVFRNEDRRCAMSFMLHKSTLRAAKSPGDEAATELRVAATSEPTVVAGSIAKKVRGGERVSVVSIGPGSVTQTIKAIVIARRYLEADRIDLSFRPDFIHITVDEGTRSAIKFVVLAQQI